MLSLARFRIASMPRDTRDTLFLLLVVGWVVLPQAANLPWWCSLMTGCILLWRAALALSSRPLPGRAWLLSLLAVTVAATWTTHHTLLGRDAGVTLVVVLLALKTLELRARRDAFVVFFLGFFTLLTNFFYSQSLAVAAAMLIGLLGLLTALVNAHMPVGKPPLSHAVGTAGTMALLGAPIMVVLFVLFPRFSPLWSLPDDARTPRTGLSSHMEIGHVASIALDESVAMRIKFDGPVPAQSDMYFRGPVLSRFDGREWAMLPPSPASTAQLVATGAPLRYEVTMEPNKNPWLLVLDAGTAAPTAPGLEAVMSGDLQWLSTRPITEMLRYSAESNTRFRHGPASREAVPAQYTELPAGFDPRTQQLAHDLVQSIPTGADKSPLVNAALDRLRRGGYSYTLDPGVYGVNTADEFWFERKEGFCEHIASAFAVLMRAMDIPARVVTGYQGGELNPVDGYWTVRQSDAHAWTEVWLAGRGWVRVDPTAAVAPSRTGSLQRLNAPRGVFASAIGAVTPTFAAQFRAVWEALNNAWNQRVLNYTQGQQLELLRKLGFQAPSWEDLSYVFFAVVALLSALAAAWAYWERLERDPWLRLLGHVRQRLTKYGLEVPGCMPPRQIATLVTSRFGLDARSLADWLLQFEAQRYGRDSPANVAALRRRLKQLTWPL